MQHGGVRPATCAAGLFRVSRLFICFRKTASNVLRRAVTAEMALRLSRYFGTTAQLWQNLQTQYDLEIASRKIGKRLERAITPLARLDLPSSTP